MEFVLYLTHVTPRRLYNFVKCWVGFLISRLFRRPYAFGLPYSVSVEPSSLCNLACPECPTGANNLGREQGNLDYSLYRKVTDQISSYAFTVLLHFQGEPMLNPNIVRMIAYASSKRLITELATNATHINQQKAEELVNAGLKKIVLTIDTPHNSDSGFYRKGIQTQTIVDAIGFINQAKAKYRSHYPLVVLELLSFKRNISAVADFVELSRVLRVDVSRVKTANLLDPQQAHTMVPLGTKFSRYRKTANGKITLKGKDTALCSAPWTKFSVTHNGEVLPCCFDKSGEYPMGSLTTSSISEVWNGVQYNNFRRNVLANRRNMRVCNDCAIGRTPTEFNVV